MKKIIGKKKYTHSTIKDEGRLKMKGIKKLFSIILSVCMLVNCFTTTAVFAADDETPAVYVSSKGKDTAAGTVNAPVKNLYRAYELLKATGGTIYITSQLTISTDTTLSGTSYTDGSKQIEIEEGNQVTLKRVTSYTGILIQISSGKLILSDITIDGQSTGTGVTFSNSSKLEINNGTNIINVKKGITNSGTLVMNGGILSSNAASAVGVNNTGTFTMNGGTISGFSDRMGGGVYNNGGEFTMTGGEISNNEASYFGGGVYNKNGTFAMTGGKINNNYCNTISDAGGVSSSNGTFTMSAGEISGNDPTGVLISGGEFTMNGGTISTSNGPGVYNRGGKVTIDGGTISENEDGIAQNNSASILSIKKGNITDNQELGLNIMDGTETVTMDGGTISNNGGIGVYSYKTSFTMNNGNITNNAAGIKGGSGKITINGGSINKNTNGGLYAVIAELNDGSISNNGEGVTLYNSNASFVMNGGSISNNPLNYGIVTDYDKVQTVTLTNGTISGNRGGVSVGKKVEFIMTGGTISNNIDTTPVSTASSSGVYNAGTSTMNGGEIIDNTTPGNGAGIYNSGSGIFTMNGGTISGNKAGVSGGGVYNANANNINHAKFTMTGGTISGNSASQYGSGVYNAGIFNMQDDAVVDTNNDIYVVSPINITDELNINTSIYGLLTPSEYTDGRVLVNVEYDSALGSDVLYADVENTIKKWNLTPNAGWFLEATDLMDSVNTTNQIVLRYKKPVENFTVKFVDYDDSIIDEKTVEEGTLTSTIVPTDPTRESDAPKEYVWEFSGWTPEIADKVTKNVTYKAQYEKKYINYNIKFIDYDNSTISEKTDYHYSDTVVVPANPTRVSDATKEYTWKFKGWSSEIKNVTEDAVYKATYEKEYIDYSIKFVDYDDSIISEKINYHYGDTVTVPTDPTRQSDAPKEYKWKFTGWTPEVKNVADNTVYKATYEKEYINYSIKFVDYDDSTISEKINYHYGDTVTVPTDPTRESDAPKEYKWKFIGWTPEVKNVTGDTVYKATYEKEYVKYSIKFVDYDDSVLDEKEDYHYGDTITVPKLPERAADDKYTYEFTGWTPEVKDVTEDAVYKATYKSIPKKTEEPKDTPTNKPVEEPKKEINPQTGDSTSGWVIGMYFIMFLASLFGLVVLLQKKNENE